MGWDAYISDNLMAPLNSEGLTLKSAAILGLDGSVWAKSELFPEITPEEFNKMIEAMVDSSITAIFINGEKFHKMSSDETVLRGRKNNLGFIARKTATTIIMGVYMEPGVDARLCSRVVEALADYLENQGY